MFKKSLSDNECLIMEPGLIMYFLQDNFYSNEALTVKDIQVFNQIFVNADFIIYVNCDARIQFKRLQLRRRGLPQRMRNLNKKNIYNIIEKSNNEIKKYILNSNNLKDKFIDFKTPKNFNQIKKLANSINLKH